jgi:hypothetical protein
MESEETEYAAEGTAAHTVSEWAREQGVSARTFIGRSLVVGRFTFVVDSAFADAVDTFVRYVDELPGIPRVEARVHYTAWVKNGWGTSDDIRLPEDKGTCYITDLKFGQGVKKYAEGNSQLLAYALGVWQDFGPLYEIEDFELAIHQPRLNHIDSVRVSVKELLLWARDVLIPAYEEAMGPDAKFVPGDHCRFCPAKKDCAARADFMLSMLEADFDTPTNELPAYRVAELYPRLEEFSKWLGDIKARAQQLLESGDPEMARVAKFVEGRGSRSWVDEKEAETALRKKLKAAQVWKKSLISPAEAEKLLGKKHEYFKPPAEGGLVNRASGRPLMVPIDDKRPSLALTGEGEFNDESGESDDGNE